jgi:hypothetical protein
MFTHDDLEDFEFSTLAVHIDKGFEHGVPDIAPPMHVTTTFSVPNDDHLIYSRARMYLLMMMMIHLHDIHTNRTYNKKTFRISIR